MRGGAPPKYRLIRGPENVIPKEAGKIDLYDTHLYFLVVLCVAFQEEGHLSNKQEV